MDQTAKEIFLAAQNHLTLEVSNGTIPRLLHMEAQGEFSDDQKQAKLGNFGRKYSAGGGERGNYLRGSL